MSIVYIIHDITVLYRTIVFVTPWFVLPTVFAGLLFCDALRGSSSRRSGRGCSWICIGETGMITLWLCQHSHWKWPFIVDLPIKMVIFHSYVNVYQRVNLEYWGGIDYNLSCFALCERDWLWKIGRLFWIGVNNIWEHCGCKTGIVNWGLATCEVANWYFTGLTHW